MTIPGKSRESVIGLDLIRLAAALVVVAYHLGYWWWHAAVAGPELQFREAFMPFNSVAASGWVGVPVFFVLSGFVIAFSAQGRTAAQFVKGRAARLYPAAWICATITLATRWAPGLLDDYARSIVLLPVGPWISGLYWTLAIEIIFYMLVAIVLWRASSAALVRLAYALGAWSLMFWSLKAADRLYPLGLDGLFGAIENDRGFLLLAHDGAFFALGMLMYEVSVRPRLALVPPALLFGAVGAAAVLWRGLAITSPPSAAVALAIWLVAVMLMIGSIFGNAAIWRRFGGWAPIVRTLGLMTYPLYLVHSEFGREIMRRLAFLGPAAALAFGVTAVLATAAMVLPLERWIRTRIFAGNSKGREGPATLP